MTFKKISDKDMQHCHFLKLTCDIGDSPSRAPRQTNGRWPPASSWVGQVGQAPGVHMGGGGGERGGGQDTVSCP